MSPETRPATTLKLVETGATTKPASNLVKPPPSPKNDEDVGIEAFRAIDRMREALAAQLTAGISPAALALAFFDWSIYLGVSPGKQSRSHGRPHARPADSPRMRSRRASTATRRPALNPCLEITALPPRLGNGHPSTC